MSYDLFATRDGVTYTGRVAEKIKDDTYCVDMHTASDGDSLPDEPLFLTIPPGLKTGDQITVKRQEDAFFLVGDKDVSTQGRDLPP